MAYSVQNIINIILDAVPQAMRDDTVDTLKIGDGGMEVSGIVTTFTVTMEVIKQAESLGANFIITHEPTFYDHKDQVETWLQNDPVVTKKRQMLAEKKMAVWRFHDNWHRYTPDGILTGMVRKLHWEQFQDHENPAVFSRAEMMLSQLAEELKHCFRLDAIKVIGHPEQKIKKIGFLMGAPGGEWQITFLSHHDVDAVICGEPVEWQTGEYLRDASIQGRNLSLLLLGHVLSEQAGMHYLVEWLRPKIPGIPIHYVEVPDLFRSL